MGQNHTPRPTRPSRQFAPGNAPKEAIYRIRNRKQYNDALVRRGSLTLRVDEATLQARYYQGPTQQGAQYDSSDTALECPLTLRAIYHLPSRATAGFAQPLFGLMGQDLDVPDYPTLCRRAATSRITPPSEPRGHSTGSSTAPG